MNLPDLFRQALFGLGLVPLKFVVQCALFYQFWTLFNGAKYPGGPGASAALTATCWLTISLTQYLRILIPIVRRRTLALLNAEAAELYQLKVRRQGDENQKRFLAELSIPFSFQVIVNQSKSTLKSLLCIVIGVAIAALFFSAIFTHATVIAILACAVIIATTDLIFAVAQAWITRGMGNVKRAEGDALGAKGEAQESTPAGAKHGKLAAFNAALQDGNELIKAAEARFQLEVQNNPGPSAYNERGKHYLSGVRYIAAVNDFSRAISLCPGCAEAYENRADAYAAMRLPILAGKEYNQACSLYAEQGKEAERRKALEKCEALSGAAATPRAGMRESLAGAAFFFNPKKVDELTELELKRINSGLEKNVRSATMHCKKAEILYRQSQLGEALLSCEKAISANDEDGTAYRIRADIKVQQSKIGEALADYDKAIGLNNRDGDAFLGRARLYFRARRDAQAALKDCTDAMSFSRDRHLHLLRGEIFISLDRCQLAVGDLTEFIESWERFINLWEAFLLPIFRSIAAALRQELVGAYKLRANAYEKLGQLDKCAQDLARAENLRKKMKGK